MTFDEKCKNCGSEMEELHSDGYHTMGTEYWYWCPVCGTTFQWYDSYSVDTGEWKTPERSKS